MWIVENMRWETMIRVGLIGVTVLLLSGEDIPGPGEEDWLEALRGAVRVEQTNEGPFWGSYAPYMAQLNQVQAALERKDEPAIYAAMNRFMDMLEKRENGIPAERADWLFDYCYTVTPAQFHDVSRHIRRFREHQFGEPVG
ncbi:MAG: hypothetical protein C4534_10220 [Gaiellales bacterium]|nr:MAG: hypothetical protein C4534_10220 [Gaiellales bacterium]